MLKAGAIGRSIRNLMAGAMGLVACLWFGTAHSAPLRLLLARAAAVEALPLSQVEPGRPGTTLRLTLQTAEGLHELRLRRKDSLGVLSARVGDKALAYHGYLPNRQGSWAAVTRIGNRWTGLWFDGVHYYGLESAQQLASISVDAAKARPADTLVYRLSDATFGETDLTGDIRRVPQNAESLAETVAIELVGATPSTALATLPNKRVSVALLADTELALQDGTQTEINMLARLNIVDEIFSSQVGVRVLSGSVTIFDAASQPFTSTTDSSTLLDEVAAFRARTSAQRASGFTHLMTGRNLDTNTVGIAYIRSLCRGDFGASLSEARISIDFSALIAAHEIGHVFGAPHDGAADGACPNAPTGFLMAPQLNNSRTFSACSLEQISAVVATAQCLAPADAADAALEVAANENLAINVPKDVTINVRSVGNVSILDARLRITLPAAVSFQSGSTGSTACTNAAGVVDCVLGAIPAGSSTAVTLRVLASAAGSSTASLRVTASNDGLASNNTASIQFLADSGTDLVIGASGSAATLNIGESLTATFTVENRGPAAVTDARLSLNVPTSLAVTQLTTEAISCATVTTGLGCGPIALAVGATARVVLSLRAASSGIASITGNLTATRAELQPTNNTGLISVTVNAPPAVTPPPSSSGGGAWSVMLSAGLSLLIALKLARNRWRGSLRMCLSGRLPSRPAW
jgi:Metallo-peptidase family M12/Domain of unknown function DUF11